MIVGTAAKLVKSTDLSRLHPRIPSICLEERYIPVFVERYGCSNDLNEITNLHCWRGVARYFFPRGFQPSFGSSIFSV